MMPFRYAVLGLDNSVCDLGPRYMREEVFNDIRTLAGKVTCGIAAQTTTDRFGGGLSFYIIQQNLLNNHLNAPSQRDYLLASFCRPRNLIGPWLP